MNIIEKSDSIWTGLRQGFQDGTSKMDGRKCYGYNVEADGELDEMLKLSRRLRSQNLLLDFVWANFGISKFFDSYSF